MKKYRKSVALLILGIGGLGFNSTLIPKASAESRPCSEESRDQEAKYRDNQIMEDIECFSRYAKNAWGIDTVLESMGAITSQEKLDKATALRNQLAEVVDGMHDLFDADTGPAFRWLVLRYSSNPFIQHEGHFEPDNNRVIIGFEDNFGSDTSDREESGGIEAEEVKEFIESESLIRTASESNQGLRQSYDNRSIEIPPRTGKSRRKTGGVCLTLKSRLRGSFTRQKRKLIRACRAAG